MDARNISHGYGCSLIQREKGDAVGDFPTNSRKLKKFLLYEQSTGQWWSGLTILILCFHQSRLGLLYLVCECMYVFKYVSE